MTSLNDRQRSAQIYQTFLPSVADEINIPSLACVSCYPDETLIGADDSTCDTSPSWLPLEIAPRLSCLAEPLDSSVRYYPVTVLSKP